MSETTGQVPEMFLCWQSVDLATRRRIAAMAWHTEKVRSVRVCVDETGHRCPWSVPMDAERIVGSMEATGFLTASGAHPELSPWEWDIVCGSIEAFMHFADRYGAPAPGAPDPGIVPIPPPVMAAALGVEHDT